MDSLPPAFSINRYSSESKLRSPVSGADRGWPVESMPGKPRLSRVLFLILSNIEQTIQKLIYTIRQFRGKDYGRAEAVAFRSEESAYLG